jgi:hypothetical protein
MPCAQAGRTAHRGQQVREGRGAGDGVGGEPDVEGVEGLLLPVDGEVVGPQRRKQPVCSRRGLESMIHFMNYRA